MKKLILRAGLFAGLMMTPFIVSADDIVNGVHGYTPKGYVAPKDPAVQAKLEWFRDQKLGFFVCLGLYSQLGIIESWALSDQDASWSRRKIDWTKDGELFKKQYWGLIRSFNPVCIEPDKWAALAADNGFKYLILSTKHHDGFCLWDSKYTTFKSTAPECPFATDPHADIIRCVFDAFRKRNLGIAAYFSKPDWYNTDFWEDHGMGRRTTRMPTYNTRKNPAKWQKFRDYTRNQMLELAQNYGPFDIFWLDGGQVKSGSALDINIEGIIADVRKTLPGLISVDRCGRNSCEDVITPEQTVPKSPIAVPWESCVTLSSSWAHAYEGDVKWKSTEEVIHLLMDIVAKGGNLALGVAPRPDGRFPIPMIERINALGAWLKKNGEAVYATRVMPPFRQDAFAFTRNPKTGAVYVTRLWKTGEETPAKLVVPVSASTKVTKVTHLASGAKVPFRVVDGKVELTLPTGFKADTAADAFRFE